MDIENITILEKDLEAAQAICASISDPNKRNRAVANTIAAKVAAGYFDTEIYQVDSETGLHNIASLIEQFEISDIYVNNAYINVRVYFSDDELCVPKIHYETGILPAAYMFLKLSPSLDKAEVTGFINPDRVDLNNSSDDVYFVTSDDLVDIYSVESKLSNILDTSDVKDSELYEFLEGSLNEASIINLFKQLIVSRSCRIKLLNAVRAQSVFNFVSVPDLKNNSEEKEETIIKQDNVIAPEYDESNELTEDDLDSLFESEQLEEDSATEYSTSVTPSGASVIEEIDNTDNQEQNVTEDENIDTLFTGEQQGVPVPSKKQSSKILPILLTVLLLCAGGYWWYTNLYQNSTDDEYIASQQALPETADEESSSDASEESAAEPADKQQEAMPDESVENNKPTTASDKEISSGVTTIPAIEQNIDASVLVSNLKVDWEVPAGYASNTSAKRYFIKLGKIIQLNLKSELLLLNKPPLTNKITVEIKYNSSLGQFEVVGIQTSSGEKSVDDVILQVLRSALRMNITSTVESFAKIQGNPVLIIHL